ncbi:MAG TPA: NAD-binding protein [Candidatus Omnitrophota bacterium]|nr:NAD-binding protein [Candidatus Omnitrophota bacterium]
MFIVIVGGGKVGFFLAKQLLKDKHTVSLVEKDKNTCEQIAKQLDILVINGDGCNIEYLEQAGIHRAEVLAAVTGDDEDNLVICQLAKDKFNVSRTVGRVNDPTNAHSFSELGVDVPVDSTGIIAKIIEEEVSFADFVNLMSFKRGKLAIVRVDLPADSPAINKRLQDISLPPSSVLVSIIRGEGVIVPKGDTVLLPNDDIIALTLVENEQQLLNNLLGKI